MEAILAFPSAASAAAAAPTLQGPVTRRLFGRTNDRSCKQNSYQRGGRDGQHGAGELDGTGHEVQRKRLFQVRGWQERLFLLRDAQDKEMNAHNLSRTAETQRGKIGCRGMGSEGARNRCGCPRVMGDRGLRIRMKNTLQ